MFIGNGTKLWVFCMFLGDEFNVNDEEVASKSDYEASHISADDQRCEGVRALLMQMKTVPYGVLGSGDTGQVDYLPDAETAFVDPAGLHIIRTWGPSVADGAAGAIYRWLGIASHGSFPEPVKAAITSPLKAKFHSYGSEYNNEQKKQCIHVVGPDFRMRPYMRAEAVAELASACARGKLQPQRSRACY